MSASSPSQEGFSLVELAAVVSIVAILTSVAYPSYREQVVRTYRSEAQQCLVDLANRQEQYLMDARAYGSLSDLGTPLPSRVADHYDVAVAPDNTTTPPSFVITAAPRSGSPQEGDWTLRLDNLGRKTPQEAWR